MTPEKPLGDVRVLEIATFLAAPFCGTVLADFGAEVIKFEQPGEGDSLRRFGTISDCGDSYVWLSEARNKRSATLDLRKPEGAGLFRQLVADADVVLENFRPGTLERWGLGFEDLKAINPRLVMLRISAYGQTGPYRARPGFARIAHGFSGLSYLAGEAGGPPVVPGSTSLGDYMSGMWGAIAVLTALRTVAATGRGQVIDIGLYESTFRVLDELAPLYAKTGFVRERMGADIVNTVPHSHYQCADGVWVALACSNERMFERLCAAMARPELARDERYNSNATRVARRNEVNGLVAAWAGALTSRELMDICEAHEVPVAPLYSIAEIFEDPQYAAREDLQRIDDPRVGELVLPAAVPRMSETPPELRHAGPALGEANDYVFKDLLGLPADRIGELVRSGVI